MSGYFKASTVLYHGYFQFLRFAPGQLEIAHNLLREAEAAEKEEQAMPQKPHEPTVWAEAHEAIAESNSAAPISSNATTA